MEHLIDPETFVGKRVTVHPEIDDLFFADLDGWVRGVRNGFLQVEDAEGDVWGVEISQVTICL